MEFLHFMDQNVQFFPGLETRCLKCDYNIKFLAENVKIKKLTKVSWDLTSKGQLIFLALIIPFYWHLYKSIQIYSKCYFMRVLWFKILFRKLLY